MADPIREALERLLAADDYIHVASPEYVQAREAARTALAAEPPTPASSSPLDLDALLSPEGAYGPGTGQEDGAQLVDQLQWWAPMHGCETLENLLDRIRRRILPHLRPPIAGTDVPGPDGDYGGLQELCEAEGVDVRIGAPLLKRAREAWGAAQPPAPAQAADGEREELAADLDECADSCVLAEKHNWANHMRRAASLLRQPAPAPVPVPVAERPWERPGWCDAEGFLWLWDSDRRWVRQTGTAGACNTWTGSFALPHWAVPQPPQGGEVEA